MNLGDLAGANKAPIADGDKAPDAPRVDSQIEELLSQFSDGDDTPENTVVYSAPEVPNLSIGEFKFTDGQMKLPKDREAEFDKLLTTLDYRTQFQVKKVDFKAALEEQLRKYGLALKTNDSSIDAPPGRQVGTEDLLNQNQTA